MSGLLIVLCVGYCYRMDVSLVKRRSFKPHGPVLYGPQTGLMLRLKIVISLKFTIHLYLNKINTLNSNVGLYYFIGFCTDKAINSAFTLLSKTINYSLYNQCVLIVYGIMNFYCFYTTMLYNLNIIVTRHCL